MEKKSYLNPPSLAPSTLEWSWSDTRSVILTESTLILHLNTPIGALDSRLGDVYTQISRTDDRTIEDWFRRVLWVWSRWIKLRYCRANSYHVVSLCCLLSCYECPNLGDTQFWPRPVCLTTHYSDSFANMISAWRFTLMCSRGLDSMACWMHECLLGRTVYRHLGGLLLSLGATWCSNCSVCFGSCVYRPRALWILIVFIRSGRLRKDYRNLTSTPSRNDTSRPTPSGEVSSDYIT